MAWNRLAQKSVQQQPLALNRMLRASVREAFGNYARAVIDECSINFERGDSVVHWLCAAVSWAMNSQVNASGYSPAQWVLGRGLRLPETLQGGNLALASRLEEDPEFAQRIAIQSAAQRSIVGLRFSRALSRAFLARSRASSTEPVANQLQIGDQVFYWRGINQKGTKSSNWALRWRGPAVVIGREQNNLWLSHRGACLKCSCRHVRHALPEELLPANEVLEELAR